LVPPVPKPKSGDPDKGKSTKRKRKRKKKKKGKVSKVRAELVDRDSEIDLNLDERIFNFDSSFKFPNDPDDLPNPIEKLKEAIGSNFDPSVFADHQFPRAPNVIEWCRGHEYLNSTTDLFPRQFQHLALFFSDVCFNCSDVDYVFNVPVDAKISEMLDRFALLQHGVCPICQQNRTEILQEWINDPKFVEYTDYDESVRLRPVPPNELCCVWGQRSGKSHMSSDFVSTYQMHRYLSIPSPIQYYHEPSSRIIEGIFVATILPQVSKTLWTPFCQALENSPWFRDVVKYTKSEGKRIGLKLFRSGQTYINFVNKNLTLHMAAANSSSLRGGIRALCVIDELGWFNYDEEGKRRSNTKDGEQVFRSLHNSCITLRNKAGKRRKAGDYNAIDAIMCNVSSPSSKHDPIMQRADQSKSKFRIHYSHHSSFEVNPDLDVDEVCDEFSGSQEDLMRDIYAIPPAAASPFWSDQSLLEDRVYPGDQPDHLFRYSIETDMSSSGLAVLQPKLMDVRADRLWPRVVGVDNGETKNSFALCMARYLPEIEGVIFEEFMEVAPHSGKTVDLAWCHNEVVLKLLECFNVTHVIYDQWNSGFSFYDISINKGIVASRYRLGFKDFRAFKDDLLGEKVWLNEPESTVSVDDVLSMKSLVQRAKYPRTNFMAQLLTVNEFGRFVVKPEFGNDDLFRCALLCHQTIMKNKKFFKDKTKNMSTRRRVGNDKVGAKRANLLPSGTYNLPRSWYGKVPGRRPRGNGTPSRGPRSSTMPMGIPGRN
jgi:hypothetical protein